MDEDLQAVATLLDTAEPTTEVIDDGRRRLQRATLRRPRPGRWAMGVGATAVVAAGAVVAVAVTSGPSAPTGGSTTGGPRTPATSTVSGGQNVLLAAATTAADTPDATGTYWHVKLTYGSGSADETWRSRDGRLWVRGDKTHGTVVALPMKTPMRLAGTAISVPELRSLPQNPTALRAWITKAVEHNAADGSVRTSGGKLSAAQRSELVVDSLTSLVSQLPAPERVRAAAFRVLATRPGVRDLGRVDGGRAISFPAGDHTARLVIDPKTARVRGTNFVVTADGTEVWLSASRAATVTGEWTDTLPR
ncbi:CU044_5270 family protein [Actinocatenispora sera]|uniref:CU044_5270 family protein n=1 Tax=Actinocatenispora sera TaxID=390989 RepID=UPI0033D44B8B